MSSDREQVAVVGVYETEQARRLPDRTAMGLLLEAARGALDDAGLSKDDIDGVAGEWPGPGGSSPDAFGVGSRDWAGQLGGGITWVDDTMPAGVPALINAAAAIRAGLCTTVLIVGGQAGAAAASEGSAVAYTWSFNEFMTPWGITTPTEFALVAQRHMALYGITPEQMASVSATIRNHGSRNPKAVMYGRGPYTADDILDSPLVCTPFHLLDLSIVSEGAAAMIVTTGARARDLRRPPAYLLGGGGEIIENCYVNPPVYDRVWNIGKRTASTVFGRSGVEPGDVDVFQLYDPTSFEVIRQFEVFGYCGPGEGGDFVQGDTLTLGGSHPTNTDGGLLSHAHLGIGQLTQKVIEAVQQLRGECGDRQVPDARFALAAAGGSAAQFYYLALLGRDAP